MLVAILFSSILISLLIFKKENYSSLINKSIITENYSSDTLIKNKQALIKYAEPILFKTYSKEKILGEKPYVISLKKGIWIMEGTLPDGYLGGTFHIEIKANDGNVIRIIHYK